ncbi:4-coumarate--CoA ligase 3 [Aphelenchoides besseyi]|nr:4-coumarate--CoA ligase 3 [Aphelenchoides besseyi]KAI6225053.1 4-coumarate--CoA ligase 3 [Aphelenchoides besseyi]
MIFNSDFPPIPDIQRPIADEWLETIWNHGVDNPKRAAFIVAETGEQITFHQLYWSSLSVASYLKEMDFGHGDLALVILQNCWQYYPIFFGCALRGGELKVEVNEMFCLGAMSGASPLFTDFELNQQFVDSKAKIVFCMDYALDRVLKATENCSQLQKIILVDGQTQNRNGVQIVSFSQLLQTIPTVTKTIENLDLRNDVVLLPYSRLKFCSGTTGKPKGVMQSNFNYGMMLKIAFNHMDQQVARRMDPNWNWRNEHIQSVLPFYHTFGFSTTLVALFGGSSCVIVRKFEPRIFLKTIQDYRIRIVFMVPPMILFLSKSSLVDEYNLSSINYIQAGAAPLSSEIIELVKHRLPNIKQISQGYGMTEMSFANHFPVFGADNSQASGKLMSNCQMKIVDLESRKPLGTNERGEICIRGPIRMIGYFNRPEATREIFDDDDFIRTGDIGFVDDVGLIYVVDRIKELIKVKGYQVAPAELEALLLTNPRIRDCAVFGVPHSQNGEAPRAFVVPADPKLTVDEVLEFVKTRAAPYKQLLGGVQFTDSIPKSPSGKIIRRKLKLDAKL